MKYEIVQMEEQTVVGLSARTSNTDPDMGAVISGMWKQFYSEGIYASIPHKTDGKALGMYMDYAGDQKGEYTALVACRVREEPEQKGLTVRRIPAGPYARFVVRGDMIQAVAAAWQEIWQMDLPRSFRCDYEEYQDDSMDGNAEIHIYVGLMSREP